MKSILIEKPNQLSIIEREIPTPSAGEVRVKVKLAGICGSDSHIYRGHNPFAKYPRVIGHEFFGVIDAVGDGVESARVGERVAVDPVVSCGHCYPCSIGKPNVCTTLAVLGVHADGGFSEYAVVPAKNAWKIPEAVADQYAVMIEPFTIAANVTGHGQPTENDTVLVYGAGPIGLTIVQVLKGVYNVKNVIVADRIDERLEKAKESGADWAINNSQTPLGESFAEKGIKPTLIIDAACHPSILKEAVTLASPAARIVLMGFSSEPSEVIQQGITGKELSIFSSRLNANKFPVVIDWLSKGLIKPEKLITHTFDFQQFVYDKSNGSVLVFISAWRESDRGEIFREVKKAMPPSAAFTRLVHAETNQVQWCQFLFTTFNNYGFSAADLLSGQTFSINRQDLASVTGAANHNTAASGDCVTVTIVGRHRCFLLSDLQSKPT